MHGSSICSHILLTIVLLLILPYLSRAQRSQRRTWSVYDFPDPQSLNQDYQRQCGRFNVSAVCDPSRIISTTQADAIDNLINEVYRETSNACPDSNTNRGYIIRVALMYNFERLFRDGDNTSLGMLRNAQMYTYLLSQKWRLQGACNETVLIMYARSDNMLYTLTRRAARERLTDQNVSYVSMMVRHYFDNKDTIAEGLLEMIRRYKLIFQGRSEEALGSGPRG